MSTSPYHQAGKMMQQILTERKSIKTIAFSKSKLLCSKSTYAQVCNTLQHKTVIDSILNHNSGYLRKAIEMDKARSSGLVYVLLFELLFGKYRSIRGGGKIKRCIMKFEKGLNKTKSLIVKDSLNTTNQLVVPVFPRYVRVNKLKATTEEVVKLLKNDLDSSDGDDKGINDIYQDVHVPDLLVLSPKVPIQWHDSKLVSSGKIVLQDKSSCFSALALVHGSESTSTDQANAGDIIDATAAPGNKTLHLAALVYDNILKNQEGKKGSKKKKKKVKVFAFDRSSARIAILKERVSNLAPSVLLDDEQEKNSKQQNNFPVDVCPIHEDFLKADPKDKKYKNVKSILLDPSCSGSGIVNSIDRVGDNTKNKESEEKRIESLSNFQLVALKHAMSFSQCVRIVYSTCSINQRENEDVVATALSEVNEQIEDEEMKWDLVSPMALKHWKRRGYETDDLTKEQSECLVRVNGREDDTNGFFVSYFERKKIINEDSSEPLKLVRDTTGVKAIYNGEFAKQNVKIDEKPEEEDVKEVDNEVADTKPKASKPVPKVKKPLPKKAAKKLLWKQKQKELKLARLVKKRNS